MRTSMRSLMSHVPLPSSVNRSSAFGAARSGSAENAFCCAQSATVRRRTAEDTRIGNRIADPLNTLTLMR